MWEAEIGGSWSEACLEKLVTPYLKKNQKTKELMGEGSRTQLIELRKPSALSSFFSTAKEREAERGGVGGGGGGGEGPGGGGEPFLG
jgi:hypothetical protein